MRDDASHDLPDPDSAGEHAASTAGGHRRFAEFVASVRTLVEMFRAYRSGRFPLTWREAALLIASLVYVVNPIDAVPEAAFGAAGLIDDVGVIVAAVAALADRIRQFRARTA